MITVYSKPNCPYCVNAKNWLSNNNFDFDIVDITQNTDAREFLIKEGHRTVPQIYQGDKILVEGGYTTMIRLGAEKLRERIS